MPVQPELELFARRKLIDSHLEELLQRSLSERSSVSEAMRYAVLGNGQRLRPLLALSIADMLGCENALSLRASLAVELVHSASLIVDDLPCMDDETTRRGRETVHRRFGESTAILAAFSLVALAARSVLEVRCSPRELSRLIDFQNELLRVLDCDALVGGQEMDLGLIGQDRDRNRDRMNELKTAPLFRVAVRAGILYASLSREEESDILQFGREFGLAYQMVDDLVDGETTSRQAVKDQISSARRLLGPYENKAANALQLVDYLYAKSLQNGHCYR